MTIKRAFALLLILILASSAFPTHAATIVTISVYGTVRDDYAKGVFELTNAHRALLGLGELDRNDVLTGYARQRAAEIAILTEHTRPSGEDCWSVFDDGQYAGFALVGENIAAGQDTPAQVFDAWLNSEGHRANIENGTYNQIGTACFYTGGRFFWVQLFGKNENASGTFDGGESYGAAFAVEADYAILRFGYEGINATTLTLAGGESISFSIIDRNYGARLVPYSVTNAADEESGSIIAELSCTEDGVITATPVSSGTASARIYPFRGSSFRLTFVVNMDADADEKVTVYTVVDKRYDMANEALAHLNAYRAENGADPVTLNAALTEIAMERAAELTVYASSSERPDGRNWYTIVDDRYRGYTNIGETVAYGYGDAEAYIAANAGNAMVTSGIYTQVGMGCVTNNGRNYWAMILSNSVTNTAVCTLTESAEADIAVKTFESKLYLTVTPNERSVTLTGDAAEFELYDINASDQEHKERIMPIASDVTDGDGNVIARVGVDKNRVILTPVRRGSGELSIYAYEGSDAVKIEVTVDIPEPIAPFIEEVSAAEDTVTVKLFGDVPDGSRLMLAHYGEDGALMSVESAITDGAAEYTFEKTGGRIKVMLWDGSGALLPSCAAVEKN